MKVGTTEAVTVKSVSSQIRINFHYAESAKIMGIEYIIISKELFDTLPADEKRLRCPV
jgi:hypothetical protein